MHVTMAPTTQTFSSRSVLRSVEEPLSLLAAVESIRHGPHLAKDLPKLTSLTQIMKNHLTQPPFLARVTRAAGAPRSRGSSAHVLAMRTQPFKE